MSEFYDAEEVAEKMGYTAQTVKIWAREGKIPSIKPGKKYLFHKKITDKWIKEQDGAYVKDTHKK